MTDLPPFLSAEMILLRWAETDAGRTVTFLLDESAPSHPFKGVKRGPEHGQMFRVHMIAVDGEGAAIPLAPTAQSTAQRASKAASIGSDNGVGPIPPPKDTAEDQDRPRKHFRELPLSQQLGIRLKEPEFRLWLCKRPCTVDYADTYLKELIGTNSKQTLDEHPDSAAASDAMAILTDYDTRHLVR